MPLRIVHYGLDQFERIRQLAEAGFTVEDCFSNVSAFAEAVKRTEVAAIAVSEAPTIRYDYVVEIARISSDAVRLLFRGPTAHRVEAESFDLVIHSGDKPEEWLPQVRELIAREQEIGQISQVLPQMVFWGKASDLQDEPGVNAEGAKVLIRFPDGRDWFEGAWILRRLRNVVARICPDEEVDAHLAQGERFGLLDLQKTGSEARKRVVEALQRSATDLLYPSDEVEIARPTREALARLLALLGSSDSQNIRLGGKAADL